MFAPIGANLVSQGVAATFCSNAPDKVLRHDTLGAEATRSGNAGWAGRVPAIVASCRKRRNAMTRKASGVPKEKPPTPLIIAEHLPRAPADLYNHVDAGWTAMKADPTHFPSPPATTEMDTALTNLGTALKAVPNGAPTDTAAAKAAATAVRELWGLNARYAQKVLRTLPVEQVPPILASVLLYPSQTGKKGRKPPIQAKRAKTSG